MTKFIHAHQTHFHSGTVGQCSMVSETRYEETARTWSHAPLLRSTQVAFMATFQLVHQSELDGMGFADFCFSNSFSSSLVGSKVREFMEEFQQVPEMTGKVPT